MILTQLVDALYVHFSSIQHAFYFLGSNQKVVSKFVDAYTDIFVIPLMLYRNN